MLSRMLAAVTKGKIGTSWTFRDSLSGYWSFYDLININAVAWNGSVFCVVGSYGRCATSPDGVTWTYRPGLQSAVGVYLYSNFGMQGIAWTGSFFVTAGNEGRVATSPDGITWTLQPGLNGTSWATTGIKRVYYLNSKILIISDGFGFTATSTDAVTWTVGAFSGMYGTCAASNNTTIVAGGPAGRINTSTDGINWTSQSGLSSGTWGTTAAVNAIAWNGSVFCAVGDSGQCATSTDGVTWTYRTGVASTSWSTTPIDNIVWNGSTFLITSLTAPYPVAKSTDGITWTVQSGQAVSAGVNGIAVGAAGAFCGGGYQSIWTSASGATWTYQDDLTRSQTCYNINTTNAVIYDGSQYVALSSTGGIGTSTDGVTWAYKPGLATLANTNAYFIPSYLQKMGSSYYACDNNDTQYASSTDLTTWTNRTGLGSSGWGTNENVSAFLSSGSKLLAVGNSYTYYPSGRNNIAATSTDGTTWTIQAGYHTTLSTGSTNVGTGAYLNSLFILCMSDGVLMTSPDGVTWTRNTTLQALSGWGSHSATIAWSGTTYCAVGSQGAATSPDLVTWTLRTQITSLPIGSSLSSILWAGSFFVAGGAAGRIATSADGITWVETDVLYNNSLWQTVGHSGGGYARRFATNGTNIVVLGSYGAAATSP